MYSTLGCVRILLTPQCTSYQTFDLRVLSTTTLNQAQVSEFLTLVVRLSRPLLPRVEFVSLVYMGKIR